nr:MAG TPA: hypothetical protein [Caudoviricetes sp.]
MVPIYGITRVSSSFILLRRRLRLYTTFHLVRVLDVTSFHSVRAP